MMAFSVKLYSHCFGVEVMEINLNLKQVMLAASLNFYFTKVQCSPFLVQTVLPIDHLFADFAFIGGT